MHFFSPHHVQLIVSCYPPSSTLLTSGPDYRPNSQELSRLTYYASNHPGKLNKLGSELLKRVKMECRKAQSGNIRMRASLLITLSIIKALATECRRDISLLSASLVASVDNTLSALPSDLEVMARTASVFTAWTTFTDGHLIGADSDVTQCYLSTLAKISNLSSFESKSSDHEVRNRTRLIGLAALTGAITSEALYNDAAQFRIQVSAIMRPLLVTLLQADLFTLNEQASSVKEATTSPYLMEFRTRPTMERRAASIHVHVDGDSGPTLADVTNACLHALFSMLEHSNGAQLGHIMRASFDSLDQLDGWGRIKHCCWFAQKASDWSQYQYRYAVPTWLVERLLENQDTVTTTSVHHALAAMVTTVFNSPTPLVNLSTSDIISNLMTLLLRRISVDPDDSLLSALVDCIASLGRHVYYSDQIQDLGMEIISRLVVVEVQGVAGPRETSYAQSRSQAIRCLLAGLLGMIRAANKSEGTKDQNGNGRGHVPRGTPPNLCSPQTISRRTKVPADVWQDTLSILCDEDYGVRADYSEALVFYLENEISKQGDHTDMDGIKRTRTSAQGPRLSMLLSQGDSGAKFLNAMHAYIYALATTSCLGYSSRSTPTPEHSANGESPVQAHRTVSEKSSAGTVELQHSSGHGRRSGALAAAPRSRKISVAQRLMDRVPSNVSTSASACASDYAHMLAVLTTVHQQLPVRGLLTGVPMLLAMDSAARTSDVNDSVTLQRVKTIKEIIAQVWLVIAKIWDCSELLEISRNAISSMPAPSYLPSISSMEVGVFHPPRRAIQFSPDTKATGHSWTGIDPESALVAIASNQSAQKATGLDRQGLLRRLSSTWTAESALKDSVERSSTFDTVRGDGVSPLLKISPALMHIDNLSLQSLARSTRGVGVTDLREALEGRSSMSNPALGGPPSISTLDHPSSIIGSDISAGIATQTRSRPKKRVVAPRPGEVREVLNRLGIGKQTGSSLLKNSFPALQKSDQRVPPYKS